ncbi:MAG: hydrogenase small subunit [Dehalococcoidales bacterium]|nr:hydrogenase small subunit [Dehalococcoidales bacterium]
MVSRRDVSRRDFIKLSAGSAAALGLLLFKFPNFETLFAASVENTPIIWLQGGSCTGCSVSVLNSLSPKIQDVLVSQVIPGKQLSLRFHPTIMAASGDLAMQAIEDTAKNKGGYVLIMEGSIPTKDGGIYCELGEKDGHGITILEHVKELGSNAMAVIALGTCAAYGGIPSAAPNPTGSKGVQEVFDEEGITTPVINLPGCPTHPDWFVGTVASILIGGLGSVEVDGAGRPLAFYGKLIHDNCPRRGHFDEGKFAKKFSEPYCLYELGCKGPVTYSDCSTRMWNGSTNWCVGANSPCIGCCNPGFPDTVSPFRSLAPLYNVTPPSWLPPMDIEPVGMPTPLAAGLGVAGGVIAGATITAIAGSFGKKPGEDRKTED